MNEKPTIEKLEADDMTSVAGGGPGTAEMSWLTDTIA